MADDVMTHMTRLWYLAYIKDTGKALYSPVSTSCTPIDSQTITVIGCPILFSELPLQAERATPYLRAIVSSEDLLYAIRLGFISTLIRSCLV
jgi:hypothetical protein